MSNASDDLVEHKPHRGKYTLIEVTELASLRAQLAAAEASNKRQVEWFDNEKAIITGRLFDAIAQLETARKALEPILDIIKREWDFKGAHPHRRALIEQAERSLTDGGGNDETTTTVSSDTSRR